MKKTALLFLLVALIFLSSCAAQQSIHELVPDVTFMNKQEVLNLYTNHQSESDNATITYKEGGKASIYVKRRDKTFDGFWNVNDDGMLTLRSGKRIDKWYTAANGKTTYSNKGEPWDLVIK